MLGARGATVHRLKLQRQPRRELADVCVCFYIYIYFYKCRLQVKLCVCAASVSYGAGGHELASAA